MSGYIVRTTGEPGASGRSGPRLARGELGAGLFILGACSAGFDRISIAVAARGWLDALINTFDVSAIVWGAAFFSVALALDGAREELRRSDMLFASCAALLLLAPVSLVNWITLTAVAVYFAACSPRRSHVQRAAFIWLAICFTMFWSPRVFAILSDYVLSADAELVSWITGTNRVGNTVELRDGKGFLWIAPTCSSMANLSIALLCWATFAQFSNRPANFRDFVWLATICFFVVAINVTRIGLIGLYPHWYDALHGPNGTLVFGYLTLFTIGGACALWKKRELFPSR